MSGGTKTETHQTQSNTIDPQQMAMYQANYATAQGNADKLGQPFTGQLTAGFTPTQLQAQSYLTNLANDPSYLNNANAASGSAASIMNSDPLSQGDLQKYMNPFQQSVIDASVSQNERARQIAQNQMNQQNSAGSAFGGSRSGVANALTNEGYDRNNQTNIANLNAANFGQAQQASLAAKGLGLNAANSAANLNNNALNLATQQGGILGAVGDAQQGQQQTELNNIYSNWMNGKNLTLQQQNILNSALGMIPVQQTTTGDSTSKTSSSPGLGSILGAVGSLGLAAATGGTSMGLSGLLGGSVLGSANTMKNALPYLSNGTGGFGG